MLVFWDLVSVMLQAGYDLAYAWPESLRTLSREMDPLLRNALEPPPDGSFSAHLGQLGTSYPDPEHRLWFQVLGPVYASGGPLVPTLSALSQALTGEEERDWASHLRELPVKTSLILAVFFVLPALLLIFLTLLTEIFESFG